MFSKLNKSDLFENLIISMAVFFTIGWMTIEIINNPELLIPTLIGFALGWVTIEVIHFKSNKFDVSEVGILQKIVGGLGYTGLLCLIAVTLSVWSWLQ